MKREQAPVALSFAYKDALESQLAGSRWSAALWVINDTDKEIQGTVHAELLSPRGKSIAASDFPASIAADGHGTIGDFSLTLPAEPGVYILRATLSGSDTATETSFIKVIPPAFSGSHRVLLIAQSKFADPIAAILRPMGLDVDVYDENAIDLMGRDLTDGSALHAKYDVVGIGCFEALAKVLPAESAKAFAGMIWPAMDLPGGLAFHAHLGRRDHRSGQPLHNDARFHHPGYALHHRYIVERV